MSTIPLRAIPAAPAIHEIPLSLYVHWPWCVRKCPYCDFNSHASPPQEAAYLDALIRDLDAALPDIWGRPVISVFIGGGTPSLMSGAAVENLLSALRARVRLLPDAEITLEANPGTVEVSRFQAYADGGVNRLSLGIQSFADRQLAWLGRIHTGAEARRAIEIALRHFGRVNLDLMLALPEQSLAEARRDLETALASGVTHISAYQLTIEPNTPFHQAPPPLPDEEPAADILEMAEDLLGAASFCHYEVSAYARPGQECRHNLNYWTFGDYLGIGAGAHTKLTDQCGIRREARPRHPKDYLADPVTRRWRQVARRDLPGEFMMNALRLVAGAPLDLFTARTGLPLATIEKSALAARQAGLLRIEDGRLLPTPLGRRFLNRLITLFLAG